MTGNGRTLTVHEATVTTAAVEIRTLTVRGKQVTLAMFRQLVEEPLVDDDGNFRGLPWGTVNYHPGKHCEATDHWNPHDHYTREHLHVVWQLGDQLRRSTVYKPAGTLKWGVPKHAPHWLKAAVCDGWRPPRQQNWSPWRTPDSLDVGPWGDVELMAYIRVPDEVRQLFGLEWGLDDNHADAWRLIRDLRSRGITVQIVDAERASYDRRVYLGGRVEIVPEWAMTDDDKAVLVEHGGALAKVLRSELVASDIGRELSRGIKASGMNLDQAHAVVVDELRATLATHRGWQDRWRELGDLPQLFIAV